MNEMFLDWTTWLLLILIGMSSAMVFWLLFAKIRSYTKKIREENVLDQKIQQEIYDNHKTEKDENNGIGNNDS